MGKSSNEKENKLSGSNIIAKILLIVIAIVLLLVLSFYAIMDGIVNLTFKFFTEMAGLGINVATHYITEVLLQDEFAGDLKYYKIDEQTVNDLKDELENSGIDTEVCGLTPVRLKKILMAQAISTSFNQTLCMSTVTEEEIVENAKQKEKYKDINSLDEFLAEPVRTVNSKDVWTEAYNYILYYDSEKFFYFKDEDDIFGGGANQWYLGGMGVITISNEETGSNMVYANSASFEEQKEDYENAQESWIENDNDFAEEELLNCYTDGDTPNTIKVWKINQKQKIYDYTFLNQKNGINIVKKGKDEEVVIDITPQIIDLQEKINVSEFAISIELMIDLLDMTGSGEFLETFIDFALSNLSVNTKAYQTEETQMVYTKDKFKIPDGFVMEVYDFIDLGTGNINDAGDDNFRAYADIVYNRTYQGRHIESVAKELKDNGNIDKDGEIKEVAEISAEATREAFGEVGATLAGFIQAGVNALDDLTDGSRLLNEAKDGIKDLIQNDETMLNGVAEILGVTTDKVGEVLDGVIDGMFGDTEIRYNTYYQVASLGIYLKSAYDPASSFELGEIEVEEKTRTRIIETSHDVVMSSATTWYGDFNYSDPHILTQYVLTDDEGNENTITEDEYNNFGYEDLGADTSATTSEQRETIYASNSIAVQYHKEYGTNMGSDGKKVKVYSYLDRGTDLADEIFKTRLGKDNKDHYDDWTANGLYEIGENDGGAFQRLYEAGTGSDFVYLKYTKDNIVKYKEATKIKRELIDTSNVQRTTADTTSDKLEKFLGLLKNDTGEIPNPPGSKIFDENGIVVMYDDIYKGKIPAGDLLLDNGALMLFEVLESNENTQGFVNIFKYLAFRYSGIDYGVTDIEQLKNILNFSGTYCSNPLLEYIKSWENSYIKNYIDGTGSYGVAQKYITQDKSKYIIYWEESSQTWNFSYGLNLTRWWI